MKIFVARGYHIGGLGVAAKLVYTIFLVFTLLGIWSSWAIYSLRIGPALDGPAGQPSVTERYIDRAADAPTEAAGGPALELDLPEEDAREPAPGSSLKWSWLLDVFHQHLFTISVVFLILAHLFMLTRLHPGLVGTVVLLGGASSLAHVLAPLIIHLSGSAQWLMPASGAVMGLSWTAMALYTLLAMWLRLGHSAGTNGR